jgi:hypothetical protein
MKKKMVYSAVLFFLVLLFAMFGESLIEIVLQTIFKIK